MSLRSTPGKRVLDNIINDLEQERTKYTNTPGKSIRFNQDEKENSRSHNISYSFSLLGQEKDRQLHLDNSSNPLAMSETGRNLSNYQSKRTTYDHMKELFNDRKTASMKSEKPPAVLHSKISHNSPYLKSNTNKLKMREKLKKLNMTKTELGNIVKEIEIEKAKIGEIKISLFNDVRRDCEELLKKDEQQLKEDLNKCLSIMNELQEWELNTEIKLEQYNSILDDDIQVMDEFLKKYGDLSQLKHQVTPTDIKVINRQKLEELEANVKNYQKEVTLCKNELEKYKTLFDSEQKLTEVLSSRNQKLETSVLQGLDLNKPDSKHAQPDYEKIIHENETLKESLNQIQNELASSLRKDKSLIEDDVREKQIQITGLIKRVILTMDPECDLPKNKNLINATTNELHEYSKDLIGVLNRICEDQARITTDRISSTKRELEKLHSQEMEKFKQDLLLKQKAEEAEYKRRLDNELSTKLNPMESKLTQLEELVESNKLKDIQIKSLNDEILELQGMCKKLENQNKHLEKNVQEEVDKRLYQFRKDNMSSISLLKEKHEKELLKNTEELKNYYEEMVKKSQATVEKVEQDNQFLEEELQNANKKIFELMKCKMDLEEAQSTARKNLENELARGMEAQMKRQEEKINELKKEIELLTRSYESKIYEIKEEKDKELDDKLFEQQIYHKEQLAKLEQTYQNLIAEYKDKLVRYTNLHDTQQDAISMIEKNFRSSRNELDAKTEKIEQQERLIQKLMNQIKELEANQRDLPKSNSQMKSYEQTFKPDDLSKDKYQKAFMKTINKLRNLGDVVQSYIQKQPSTSRKEPLEEQEIPLVHLSKEIDQIGRELIEETMDIKEDEDDFGEEQRSLELSVEHPNIANQRQSRMLNGSNISSQRGSHKERHSASINFENNRVNQEVQTEFQDDDILPPFDHRVCLRCKLNDLTSPNYCRYQCIENINDLSFNSNKSGKSGKSTHKTSKSHVYGTNVGWKSKPRSSNYERYLSNRAFIEVVDQVANTVITSQDFANKKENYDTNFFAELQTPRYEDNEY